MQSHSVKPLHVQQPQSVQETKPILLRRREVERRTGLSRSRIYALMATKDFPNPIRLGSMSVAWPDCDVDSWIAARIADSRKSGV